MFDDERARQLSLPVCYVDGTASGPRRAAATEHFLSLVPKAEVVRLEGLDHAMCTEAPARVAEVIAAFISRQP